MGMNHVTIPMSHYWKELRFLYRGIELGAFIAREMPKTMHMHVALYRGKK